MSTGEINNTQIELPEECCAKCNFGRYMKEPGQPMNFAFRECHRRAPRPQVMQQPVLEPRTGKPVGFNQQVHLLWPRLAAEEWCGDFEHKHTKSTQSAVPKVIEGSLVS